MTDERQSETQRPQGRFPPLHRQAWNLARSLAEFLADGCKTLTEEQYRARLEICDNCDQRRENRCLNCGCRLSLKARGRAFQCPFRKWPAVDASPEAERGQPSST
jgi:hypothetical protein